MRSAWSTVSRTTPCTICGKSDWCTVSADGAWALCRRVENGTGLHRLDKTGADYWLYRLDEHVPYRPSTSEPPSQSRVERADPRTLDRVYRALLAVLPLTSAHRQALRRRGLLDTEIMRRGYRTMPLEGRAALVRGIVDRLGVDTCTGIPGLYGDAQGTRRLWTLAGAVGLLIPVRDVNGRIVALQIRSDDPGQRSKYTWLSSAKHNGPGPGTPAHRPLYTGPHGDTVRVTEGPLKADITTVLGGVLTIAVPGVPLWRQALPLLEVLQPTRVLLAFDSDWRQNPSVARALAQATQALVETGYTVGVEIWDASQGKGIDDVLAAGYTPTLQSIVPWLHRARTLPEKSGGRPSHIVVEVR